MNEAIADSGERLYEDGSAAGVVESLPQPVDGIVEPAIDIDIDLARPELCIERLASDHLAGAVQERFQYAEWLNLQGNPLAAAKQRAGRAIDLKLPKTNSRIFVVDGKRRRHVASL